MRFVVPAGMSRRRIGAVAVAIILLGWLSGSAEPHHGATARADAKPRRTAAGKPTPPRPSAPSTSPTPVVPKPRQIDCRAVKCIALTFDDGPGPYTAKLLDTLARHRAKVTFFLIGGNVKGREALVRRELAEGHAVGDHSWTHPPLTTLSNARVKSELERTFKEIRRASGSGFAPTLMRPPYGDTNKRVGGIARKLGLAQIVWSVDTNDWRDRNSGIVAHRAVSWGHRNDIILMHDIHPTTVNAVPKILDGLAKKGYTFVTIPELFTGHPPKPGNEYFNGKPPATPKPPASTSTTPKPTAPAPTTPPPATSSTPATPPPTPAG